MSEAPRVGFVGAGSVLWAYLQLLDRLVPRGLAVEGPICARRRETWPGVLARRPGARLVESPAEVVAAADVVCILTPPPTHAELVRLALEAGTHVVCEKPVAGTRAEAEELFALAEARGVHLLAAPFVQLSGTFRLLWTRVVRDAAIGRVHTGRGLYGNAGSTWTTWYHDAGVGPLAEAGIYNLKSLTALLGPAVEVLSAEAVAVPRRETEAGMVERPDPDVSLVTLRHAQGALSTIVSGQAIQRYRRPGLELYGTEGTANLLGDDWDPKGIEIWRNELGAWEEHEPLDPTWLWTDGLREVLACLRDGRAPLAEPLHDLHLLDVVEAARVATREGRAVDVASAFPVLDLAVELPSGLHHVHDHTRPLDEQT